MNTENSQIVSAYETLNLSPEQIAEQFHFEITSVKAALMQGSFKYRESSRENVDDNFSDKESLEAKETILRLMRYSEDEYLQAKLARYIRDDKKGRLDIGRNLSGMTMNVAIFNNYLNQAKQALASHKAAQLPKPATQQVIDISVCSEQPKEEVPA